jgi:hypothetical protein
MLDALMVSFPVEVEVSVCPPKTVTEVAPLTSTLAQNAVTPAALSVTVSVEPLSERTMLFAVLLSSPEITIEEPPEPWQSVDSRRRCSKPSQTGRIASRNTHLFLSFLDRIIHSFVPDRDRKSPIALASASA